MEISKETADALAQEIELYLLAEKTAPNMAIFEVKNCVCRGPLPECKCAKRERLVREFLRQVANG